MQGERPFCKPPVLLVLVRFGFEDAAARILEKKLPNLPKCTLRFGGIEVGMECEHGS
jgi:hypothetical protein